MVNIYVYYKTLCYCVNVNVHTQQALNQWPDKETSFGAIPKWFGLFSCYSTNQTYFYSLLMYTVDSVAFI